MIENPCVGASNPPRATKNCSSIGRADGRYMKLLKQLARIDVLVIDDWGLAVLDDAHQLNLKGDSLRKKRANLTSSPRPE